MNHADRHTHPDAAPRRLRSGKLNPREADRVTRSGSRRHAPAPAPHESTTRRGACTNTRRRTRIDRFRPAGVIAAGYRRTSALRTNAIAAAPSTSWLLAVGCGHRRFRDRWRREGAVVQPCRAPRNWTSRGSPASRRRRTHRPRRAQPRNPRKVRPWTRGSHAHVCLGKGRRSSLDSPCPLRRFQYQKLTATGLCWLLHRRRHGSGRVAAAFAVRRTGAEALIVGAMKLDAADHW